MFASNPLRSALARSARPGRTRSIFRDRRGVSAVEFALLLPVILVLFLGGSEIGQAITAYRKVGHTANALGDLVARVSVVDPNHMSNIFDASLAVMAPFESSQAKMVVSVAIWDAAKKAWRVTGSKARNATSWRINAAPPVQLPEALKINGQGIIIARVEYEYTSAFSAVINDITGSSSIKMEHVVFLRPRVSATVDLQ